jgi:prefoldin subunit 5
VADNEALKALRDERAVIASQIEKLQAHLKPLRERLAAIDSALAGVKPSKPETRARWGSAAYRRKQLL